MGVPTSLLVGVCLILLGCSAYAETRVVEKEITASFKTRPTFLDKAVLHLLPDEQARAMLIEESEHPEKHMRDYAYDRRESTLVRDPIAQSPVPAEIPMKGKVHVHEADDNEPAEGLLEEAAVAHASTARVHRFRQERSYALGQQQQQRRTEQHASARSAEKNAMQDDDLQIAQGTQNDAAKQHAHDSQDDDQEAADSGDADEQDDGQQMGDSQDNADQQATDNGDQMQDSEDNQENDDAPVASQSDDQDQEQSDDAAPSPSDLPEGRDDRFSEARFRSMRSDMHMPYGGPQPRPLQSNTRFAPQQQQRMPMQPRGGMGMGMGRGMRMEPQGYYPQPQEQDMPQMDMMGPQGGAGGGMPEDDMAGPPPMMNDMRFRSNRADFEQMPGQEQMGGPPMDNNFAMPPYGGQGSMPYGQAQPPRGMPSMYDQERMPYSGGQPPSQDMGGGDMYGGGGDYNMRGPPPMQMGGGGGFQGGAPAPQGLPPRMANARMERMRQRMHADGRDMRSPPTMPEFLEISSSASGGRGRARRTAAAAAPVDPVMAMPSAPHRPQLEQPSSFRFTTRVVPHQQVHRVRDASLPSPPPMEAGPAVDQSATDRPVDAATGLPATTYSAPVPSS